MDIEDLRSQFKDISGVTFNENAAGFPLIKVENDYASATLSLYGGQLLSFIPRGGEELLFVSDQAYFAEGKAIKGGVPICWPWFGADPENKGRPAHGFVRNRFWELRGIKNTRGGDTLIVMGVSDSEDTKALWPAAFDLELEVSIGEALTLTLSTSNRGSEPFVLTQALHTYFSVADIQQVEIRGLEGKEFIDKSAAGNDELKLQQGPVRIEEEVDRIYLGASGDVSIIDKAMPRTVEISSSGSNSCVVWNPWRDIAAAMGDLGNEDFLKFVCVETTNAADDQVVIAAGSSAQIAVQYRVQPEQALK